MLVYKILCNIMVELLRAVINSILLSYSSSPTQLLGIVFLTQFFSKVSQSGGQVEVHKYVGNFTF